MINRSAEVALTLLQQRHIVLALPEGLRDGFEGFLVRRRHDLGEPAVKLDGLRLDLARFGVLQRHVEKHLLDGRQPLVFLVHRTFDAELEGKHILRERIGGVAVDVAPELVDQQDQCKAPFRFIRPVIQLATAGAFDIVREFLLDLVVEYGILAEPDVHAPVDLRGGERLFLEPERQDGIDTNPVIIGNRRVHAFAKEFYRHFDVLCRRLKVSLRL